MPPMQAMEANAETAIEDQALERVEAWRSRHGFGSDAEFAYAFSTNLYLPRRDRAGRPPCGNRMASCPYLSR